MSKSNQEPRTTSLIYETITSATSISKAAKTGTTINSFLKASMTAQINYTNETINLKWNSQLKGDKTTFECSHILQHYMQFKVNLQIGR